MTVPVTQHHLITSIRADNWRTAASVFMFLALKRSYFFMQVNTQKIPKKSNSFLHHFINNKLDEFVTEVNVLPETLILKTATIHWHDNFTCF
jgi:hypothetical protein